MTLPRLNTPTYTTTLPFSQQEVKFRPLLTGDDKKLLIASESENSEDLINTFYDVVADCTFNQVDCKQLPAVDLEWLLLELRKRSKGKDATLVCICQQVDEKTGEVCNHKSDIVVNLDNVRYVGADKQSLTLNIQDGIGVKLAPPTNDVSLTSIETIEQLYDAVISVLECIFADEQVWWKKDLTRQQLVDFIDQLPPATLEKIKDFIANLPHLEVDVSYTCAKCGNQTEFSIKGIHDFFD